MREVIQNGQDGQNGQGGIAFRAVGLMMALLSILLLPVAGWADGQPQILEKSELIVESGDRALKFQVEVADEPEERRVGLMFRREMAADHGMLFDFEQNRQVSMWMRNTYISLDMLFIAEGGEIVNIGRDTVPESEAIVGSAGPVRYVLEVPAGTTRLLGIKPGDKILHEAIGNKPNSDQVNG